MQASYSGKGSIDDAANFVGVMLSQTPSDRNQQANSKNTYDSLMESKSSELIELRRTLTELNDAVTQIARSGNLEQANRVRDLLVQVKREIYKFLAEQ